MYEDAEKFVDLDFKQRVRRQEGRETDYWFQALRLELAMRDNAELGRQGF